MKVAWSRHVTNFKFLGPNHISGTTEATVVKFCTHIGTIKLVVVDDNLLPSDVVRITLPFKFFRSKR